MDKCTCCEGTGKVACKTCNGEGKVTCSACGGSGREVSVCPTCTKGYVPDPRSMDDEPTLKCPDCHGEWQKDAGPCKGCDGTGKVTCASCAGTGKEECSLCNGVGDIDVEAMCKRLICIMPADHGMYKDDTQLHVDDITVDMVPAIQDAADKGLGVAMFVMGELFEWGLEIDGKVVVERDYDKATEYMRKGAEAGDPFSQGTYGLRLIYEKKEKEAAVRWLVKAGENGNIESMYFLAIHGCIYGEYGHDRDLAKALEYFNKILNVKDVTSDAFYVNGAKGYVKFLPRIINNDTGAMLELATWLHEADEAKSSDDWVTDIAHSHGVKVDKVEERAYSYWILQAAKAGSIDAMMKVAKLYWKEGEKDKANEWYEKAVSQGSAKTLLELGKRLRTGDGIAKDYSKAFVYFYRAAEQGQIAAVKSLGSMYFSGEYVEKNREHAVQLYIRAAKSGDSGALYSVGTYYRSKKDEVEAKRLFRLAAEKGNEEAKKALASIPDSVKDKNKGPSGIVVGKPDNGPLPKFVKADYDCAAAGKAAVKSPAPQSKSTSSSAKKRWKFVVLGLLFGYFGVHLAYAKRWFLFLLLWAAFITGGMMSGGKSESAKPGTDAVTAPVEQSADSPKTDDAKKEPGSPIGGIGFGVWALLWIGGTLFIKKDGKGNRM